MNSAGYCETWSCPAKPGLKLVGYGEKFGQCNYEHLCTGGSVWDTKTNSCSHCPDNTVFSGYGSGANVNAGTCKACAFDEALKYEQGGGGWKVSAQGSVASLDMLTCQKLTCAGLSHTDKKKPHECVQIGRAHV